MERREVTGIGMKRKKRMEDKRRKGLEERREEKERRGEERLKEGKAWD